MNACWGCVYLLVRPPAYAELLDILRSLYTVKFAVFFGLPSVQYNIHGEPVELLYMNAAVLLRNETCVNCRICWWVS